MKPPRVLPCELTPAAIAARGLPWELPGAWTFPEAAGIALLLPPVAGDGERPIGVGLMPPRGVGVFVRMGRATRTGGGDVIRRGARGAIGALWRGRSEVSPVHRVWFQEHGRPQCFVDCYADDIGQLEVLGEAPPALVGWELVEL